MLRLFAALIITFSLSIAGLVGTNPTQIVPAGAYMSGDVSTILENIRVEGIVAGDVTSWGGNITILGQVEGDVVSYTGRIEILEGGKVNGHVLALSGTVAGATESVHIIQAGTGGKVFSSVLGVFSPSQGSPFSPGNITRWMFSLIFGIGLLLLSLLSLIGWPQRTQAAAALLARTPLVATLLGILAGIATVALLPLLAGVLAITLIGIPIGAGLVLLVNMPYALGLAVLIRLLQERGGPAHQSNPLTMLAATLGVILPIFLVSLASPIAGVGLFYLLASPGLGAVLLSRGGTLIATETAT
jgi:hypothetical protein